MVKRGQVYFNRYTDAMGHDRRVPVLVVSEDGYNGGSQFVTTVRLVKNSGAGCPQHVFIPGSAFAETQVMGDCWALAETISSTRKDKLEGPIGVLASNYYTKSVEEGIKIQVGIEMTKPYEPLDRMPTPAQRPTWDKPWYSAAITHEGAAREKDVDIE